MPRKVISCPHCQARFDVARYGPGSSVRCGRCSKVLTVPGDSAGPDVARRKSGDSAHSDAKTVRGRPLSDQLAESGAMEPAQACVLIVQACWELKAVHERGAIHGNVTCGTLFVSPGSKLTVVGPTADELRRDARAGAGVAVGTPYYMAPEQFEGRSMGPPTDVYGLGATFYYMLTKHRPHNGLGPAQILLSLMTKEPVSIERHRPGLPKGLWPIVRRMIDRDPARRHATCDELAADVERFLAAPR